MEPARRPTLAALVSDGVLDAELAALVWLLVEGGVPVVVGGEDARMRRDVAAGILGGDPDRAWALLDAEEASLSLDAVAAAVRVGTSLGITVAGADLGAIVDRLARPPISLPEDAVRRLGVVLVTVRGAQGPRVAVAHYLRPAERDGGGHLQRRPPAVLATWDPASDAFEHYAWGLTPELGDRVGRAQADLEERQRDRGAFLARVVAAGRLDGPDLATETRAHLAAEPPVVPAPARPDARPSPVRGRLIDPEPHAH